MRIVANNSYIEFICRRVELIHYPSMTFSVESESRGFGGRLEEVSFHLLELENFIQALQNLELKHQGEARLVHITDTSEVCPLRFKIFSIDRLGHLAIEAQMQETKVMGNRPIWVTNHSTVTFEIDPGMLPHILADFKQLFSERPE